MHGSMRIRASICTEGEKPMGMIRVALVDDQEIVRFAVGSTLKAQQDIDLVGVAATGEEAIKLAEQLKPDILITETISQNVNGIETAPQVLRVSAQTRIMALTGRQEEDIVCRAMKAHFSGYVLKKCPFSMLMDAIHAVAIGQMYLCPEVVSAVVANNTQQSHSRTSPAAGQGRRQISGREREVLQLISEGRSTKEVADQLSISLKTVETHRRRVMAKLKIFSVAQLTKYAIREGLTTV